jgi:hypothetical protein
MYTLGKAETKASDNTNFEWECEVPGTLIRGLGEEKNARLGNHLADAHMVKHMM